MDINDMEKSFHESQFTVIANLQKKCDKLEEENKNLLKMLEGTVPIIQNNTVEIGISPARIICETQIALLKNAAISRELTLEEARKFQIFVDTLEKLKAEKDDGINTEVSEAELLQLVKNESK